MKNAVLKNIAALLVVVGLTLPSIVLAQAPGSIYSINGSPTIAYVGATPYAYSNLNVNGATVQIVTNVGYLVSGQAITNPTVWMNGDLKYGAAIQVTLLGATDAYGSTNSVGSTNAVVTIGTNTVTVTHQSSCDGIVWQTALVQTLTGTGTINASCVSNVSASAIRFWRFFSASSAANGTGNPEQVIITAAPLR